MESQIWGDLSHHLALRLWADHLPSLRLILQTHKGTDETHHSNNSS